MKLFFRPANLVPPPPNKNVASRRIHGRLIKQFLTLHTPCNDQYIFIFVGALAHISYLCQFQEKETKQAGKTTLSVLFHVAHSWLGLSICPVLSGSLGFYITKYMFGKMMSYP